MTLRENIEAALGRWGAFVVRRAFWVIAAVLLATAGLGSQIRHFYVETSNEAFFHPDDPIRLLNDRMLEVFGRDTIIGIALKPDGGVFDLDFLETLRAIHRAVEDEAPYIVEVNSLWNARETLGHADGLDVAELLEDWPETESELRAIEARARANPLYRNFLLSGDGRTTLIAIETEAYSPTEGLATLEGFDEDGAGDGAGAGQGSDANSNTPTPRKLITGDEDREIVRAIDAILDRHRSPDLEIHLSGMPAFAAVLTRTMIDDTGRFTALSVAIVALLLALLFRRVAAVILPLVAVGLSVFATLSLMGAVGIPMMPPTQIIPSFLLAVGIGGAVHLLAIFYQGIRRGEDKSEAIASALAHSGLPIIMTSLTTAGGLLSFIPAALAPISHFGTITPVGVLLSLFYVLTLLPALMAVVPMGTPRAKEPALEHHDPTTRSQRALIATGRFATRRPTWVLGLWALLMAISVTGLLRIRIGHDMLEWFPVEEPMYQATHFLNDEMGGAASFEIMVSTGRENGLHEPEVLRRIEAASEQILETEHLGLRAGKVVSIVDIVKETHRALNENRADAYAIPDDRELVSQELLLFENSGSDDVEDLVTSDFESARLSVRLPFRDAAFFLPYLDDLLPQIEQILGPDLAIETSGMYRLMGNTVTAALETMLRSYSTALVVVTMLMILLIGRVRMGLIAMIPNLAPVIFALGLMGWLGVPLDMFTLMLGTIVIGLAVDDTIHFMHNFRRAYEASGDVDDAVADTLRGTGQALLFTSCVLASGFLVFTQAYMTHLYAFGVLTSCAIVVAFLADVTLAPALVATVGRRLTAR